MAKIRVLVVDDSLTIRKRLVEVLSADPSFDVVGEAADGAEAVRLCEELLPDVITMDMMMPGLTGLEATERIMAFRPTPIVVVSASFNRGEVLRTFDALSAGAVDVFEKPHADDPPERWEQALRSTVRMASRIKVISHPRGRLLAAGRPPLKTTTAPLPMGDRRGLVAIGASTGGPRALAEVLSHLPADFPLPVLVVLHISDAFGERFAEWLDAQVAMPVRLARDLEPLPSEGRGEILVAPPGRHLELAGGRLRLSEGPERHACRPSVDVLFESLAREAGPSTVAALLTGMGRDGAQGLLALRRAGAFTIAQDRATSAVYGMPGEAARLSAASAVLPLREIGEVLRRTGRDGVPLSPAGGSP